MRVAALISGGKDSCYSMMQCVREGHEVVVLVNLRPAAKDEIDSYMFQTVGHQGIELLAEAMGLPLCRRTLAGASLVTSMQYEHDAGDEVEDLYSIMSEVKSAYDVDAVSVGAILSDYQRLRVENVCSRLSLTPLAYLWRREQDELLREMIACNIRAILIKVACLGLKPEKHLGKDLTEMLPVLESLNHKYGVNVCGEGGEYETFVLDCPLFNKRLCIDSTELVVHESSDVAPVAYLNLKLHLESKDKNETSVPLYKRVQHLPMMDTCSRLCQIISPDLLSEPCIRESPYVHRETSKPVIPAGAVNSEEIECSRSGSLGLHVGNVTARHTCQVSGDTDTALRALSDKLQQHGFGLNDIIYVLVFVQDMNDFAQINAVYKKFFPLDPPARICVQVDLSPHLLFRLLCFATRSPKKMMHVQSVSHWAPSNIGPYSQVVTCGGQTFVSGQIPLIPGCMRPLDVRDLAEALPGRVLDAAASLFAARCALSLHHVRSVMLAENGRSPCGRATMTTCYLVRDEDVPTARLIFTQSKLGGLLLFCVVAGLPRGVDVEWHVTALDCEGHHPSQPCGSLDLCSQPGSSTCHAVIEQADLDAASSDVHIIDDASTSEVIASVADNHDWIVSCHAHPCGSNQSEGEIVTGAADLIDACCGAVLRACRGQKQCMVFFDHSKVTHTELRQALRSRCGMEVSAMVPCRSVYHSVTNAKQPLCSAAVASCQDSYLITSCVAVMRCPA